MLGFLFFFSKLFGMPEMKRNWVESQLGRVRGICLCALPQVVAGNRIMGVRFEEILLRDRMGGGPQPTGLN